MPSRPDSRNPSRAALPSSTANARPTASSAARRTAVQKRPGATRDNRPRSGSRANAKRTRTIAPNGSTCCIATRDRRSMRRSLPATKKRGSPAGCSSGSTSIGGSDLGRPRSRRFVARPATIATSRVAKPPRQIDLVRRDEDRASFGRGAREHFVDDRASLGVESRVRLVQRATGAGRVRERDGE